MGEIGLLEDFSGTERDEAERYTGLDVGNLNRTGNWESKVHTGAGM